MQIVKGQRYHLSVYHWPLTHFGKWEHLWEILNFWRQHVKTTVKQKIKNRKETNGKDSLDSRLSTPLSSPPPPPPPLHSHKKSSRNGPRCNSLLIKKVKFIWQNSTRILETPVLHLHLFSRRNDFCLLASLPYVNDRLHDNKGKNSSNTSKPQITG